MADKEFYTVDEAAKKLGLTDETIRTYIRRGELVAYKFGNTLRIKPDDLDRFIESRRTDRRDKQT